MHVRKYLYIPFVNLVVFLWLSGVERRGRAGEGDRGRGGEEL